MMIRTGYLRALGYMSVAFIVQAIVWLERLTPPSSVADDQSDPCMRARGPGLVLRVAGCTVVKFSKVRPQRVHL